MLQLLKAASSADGTSDKHALETASRNIDTLANSPFVFICCKGKKEVTFTAFTPKDSSKKTIEYIINGCAPEKKGSTRKSYIKIDLLNELNASSGVDVHISAQSVLCEDNEGSFFEDKLVHISSAIEKLWGSGINDGSFMLIWKYIEFNIKMFMFEPVKIAVAPKEYKCIGMAEESITGDDGRQYKICDFLKAYYTSVVVTASNKDKKEIHTQQKAKKKGGPKKKISNEHKIRQASSDDNKHIELALKDKERQCILIEREIRQLMDKYRSELTIFFRQLEESIRYTFEVLKDYKSYPGLEWILDVNPQLLLGKEYNIENGETHIACKAGQKKFSLSVYWGSEINMTTEQVKIYKEYLKDHLQEYSTFKDHNMQKYIVGLDSNGILLNNYKLIICLNENFANFKKHCMGSIPKSNASIESIEAFVETSNRVLTSIYCETNLGKCMGWNEDRKYKNADENKGNNEDSVDNDSVEDETAGAELRKCIAENVSRVSCKKTTNGSDLEKEQKSFQAKFLGKNTKKTNAKPEKPSLERLKCIYAKILTKSMAKCAIRKFITKMSMHTDAHIKTEPFLNNMLRKKKRETKRKQRMRRMLRKNKGKPFLMLISLKQ